MSIIIKNQKIQIQDYLSIALTSCVVDNGTACESLTNKTYYSRNINKG